MGTSRLVNFETLTGKVWEKSGKIFPEACGNPDG